MNQATTTTPATRDSVVLEVTDPTMFHSTIKTTKGLVLVMFYGTWCGYCTRIKPFVQSAAVCDRVQRVLLLNEANIPEDQKERMQLQGYPTFWLYKDGVRVDTLSGADSNAILQMLARHR